MESLAIEWLLDTPIGNIEVTACEKGVRRINLSGLMSRLKPLARHTQIPIPPARRIAIQTLDEITEYLQQKRSTFDIRIDWSQITFFQRTVLEQISSVSFGEVYTYGQIAQLLGKPTASRAVGGALARNPIPILVPCHRVVAKNGHLTGYSAAEGIATKQWLLEMEGHRIVNQKLV